MIVSRKSILEDVHGVVKMKDQNSSSNAAPMRPAGPRRRGVTLIEALLVVLILSAVAVAGSFSINTQFKPKQLVELDRQHVRQTLRQVQNTAIANRVDVDVVIDTRDNALRIASAAGPVGPAVSQTIELDLQSRMRASTSRITFRPDGSVNRDLQLRFEQDRSNSEINISVTGDIR